MNDNTNGTVERLRAKEEIMAGTFAYVGGLIAGITVVVREAGGHFQNAAGNIFMRNPGYFPIDVEPETVATIGLAMVTAGVGGSLIIDGLRNLDN